MVSVIVPVYNVERYLPSCIESVLRQTYSDWELLLVDDGSTDRSGRICDEYAEQNSRIRVFHKENGGVSSARNLALDQMRGDFCIMLDSDDLIHPSLLEDTLQIIQDTQTDAVIYGYEKVDEHFSLEQYERVCECHSVEILSRSEVVTEILSGRRFRMLACNKLYKTALWGGIRYPIGRKYGDDTSVTYQLMSRCEKVALTTMKYYFYRDRPNSALHTNISEQNLQLFDTYSEMLSFFQENNPKFCNLAAYAYAIRLFDFFARLKEAPLSVDKQVLILKKLKDKCILHKKQLVTAEKMTLNQRILLMSFFVSEHLFWAVYR